MKSFFLICAAIILCVCANTQGFPAPAATGVTAIIRYGDNKTVAVTDFSSPIPIPANEAVYITLHFRHNAVGQPVVIETPDGGSVSSGRNVLVIGNDETLTFAFNPAAGSVQSSVDVRQGAAAFSLTFSVGAAQD